MNNTYRNWTKQMAGGEVFDRLVHWKVKIEQRGVGRSDRIGVEETVYPNLSRVPNPTNLSYMEEDLDASDDNGRRQ